jgi:asparagine synthase (glutamine-hydrolysing)
MTVQISLYDESKWCREGETAVSGSAFSERECEYLDTREICSHLRGCRSVAEVRDVVDRISGFYSFIHDLGDKIIASVDHIRSIPVYYSKDGTVITDNPREIVEQVDPAIFDPVLEAEYLLTGYVTGNQTLCPKVSTLEAGTMAIINKESGQTNIEHHTSYYQEEYDTGSSQESERELREAIIRAVERLCTVAAGRPIYVLLSGGYDSKLILSELVRQNYDTVVALSFGSSDFRDVIESQNIAERLDVERKYIEYTENTWADWFQSGAQEQYWNLRHNMDSFPHHWAGPALFELKHRNELPSDAVFVSGQTIGSVGEHMPTQDKVQSRSELVDYILSNHYNFWGRSDTLSDLMRNRIDENLLNSETDLLRIYEQWEWRERQSKWMSQDGSIYSIIGHDWWFPLFDEEVMEAWAKLPVSSRRGKSALKNISDETFIQASDVESVSEVSHTSAIIKIKQAVKGSPFEDLARYIYQKYRKYNQDRRFGTHPLGYEGMFGPGQPDDHYCGDQSHHSYIAMYAVDRLAFSPPEASGVPNDCELSIEKLQKLSRVERQN